MDLEELKEFERAIVAGEINDFKFYFEQAEDEDDIRAMRKICIENNVYKKAYPDWAEEFVFTDDYDMQYLLLDADQCLDILICSENKEVRREVVEKDIEYAFEDHVMEYDQDIIMENLMITGWLDATGQFHECTYGTHNDIAHNHNITDDDSAIYFACATSPISNSLTDVAETGFLKPTQAQLDWIETYKDQMSPTQREMLNIE